MTIGRVTDDGYVRISQNGEVKAVVPADSLVLGGGAPVYHRETEKPSYMEMTSAFRIESIPQPGDYEKVLTALLAAPNITSKQWVYRQYDTSVRTNTSTGPGGDAAVIRLKGSRKAISVKTDCNPRYVYLNPRKGAAIAVAESARNVVCSGAQPLAITNCLNFGNPYKPEVYYQFKEACGGMGDACRVFDTPVTGGNVSFYNENPNGAVYPTPVIGMLGLINDVDHITPSGFTAEGDSIILLGKNREDIDGSEYLATWHHIVGGDAPFIDLEEEKILQAGLLSLIRKGLVNSAHDVSDGGLAVTLAEACIIGDTPLGAAVTLSDDIRRDALYFGEAQSRVVVTCPADKQQSLMDAAHELGVHCTAIGVVGGSTLRINDDMELATDELEKHFFGGLERILNQT